VKDAHLNGKAQALVDVIKRNPFRTPPPYEKLSEGLRGPYSRRINAQHRLVHQVRKEGKAARIPNMLFRYRI